MFPKSLDRGSYGCALVFGRYPSRGCSGSVRESDRRRWRKVSVDTAIPRLSVESIRTLVRSGWGRKCYPGVTGVPSKFAIENGEKLRGYTYTYDVLLDSERDGSVARRGLRPLLPVPPARGLRVLPALFRINEQVCVTGSPIKSPMKALMVQTSSISAGE